MADTSCTNTAESHFDSSLDINYFKPGLHVITQALDRLPFHQEHDLLVHWVATSPMAILTVLILCQECAWKPNTRLDSFTGNSIRPLQHVKINCINLLSVVTYQHYIIALPSGMPHTLLILGRKWDLSYQQVLPELCLHILVDRSRRQKLALCFHIVKGLSLIPPSSSHHILLLISDITIPIPFFSMSFVFPSLLISICVDSLWNCLPSSLV